MLKLLATTALLGAACAQNKSLPEVDLGYEVYRAAGFNVRSYQRLLHNHNSHEGRAQETSTIFPIFVTQHLQSVIYALRLLRSLQPIDRPSTLVVLQGIILIFP
jgi:hypothetical protein